MARWYVYVVRCRDGSLYTGVSTDVAARVALHNRGRGARYTRSRLPVELLHVERRGSRGHALRREAAIKALPRARKLALLGMPLRKPLGDAVRSRIGGSGGMGTRRAAALMATVVLATFAGAPGVMAAKPGDGRAASEPLARVDRVTVPAGPFVQGSTQGEEDERPVRSRVLPSFAIDRTEVTRAAYAACVAARRCRPVPADAAGPEGADGALPVTGVSWADAQKFCRFAGGRLPTEAEWEKAARGTDGREYPWGNEPTCEKANWGNFDGDGPCARTNPGYPVSVGRYPAGASPYGAVDMAGNVWEWVSDRYDEDPSRRVVRGGSCCSTFVRPRAANRNAWSPDHRDGDLGFRCVAAR